ncbi:MAG: HAD hydrolase-like protein [Candidatus Pacebacteria bacterium]|nr:HAD hydrolase-like protein [Candidatus Paceibacterota bacterium]
MTELAVRPEETIVVDDRMIRGIAWGNRKGTSTVWLKKGKFADETPTMETEKPQCIITDIRELSDILK